MAKPTDSTGVVNLSLDILKEAKVTDIESGGLAVEALGARWYDVVRLALLRAHRWNFATKGEAIPRGGTPSISLYADYYTFPNDYVRLTAIFNPKYPLQRYDYQVESNKLLYNNGGKSSIDAWFVYDFKNVPFFPPDFTILLAAELALFLAFKITTKPSVIAAIKVIRDEYKMKALAANGQEKPPIRYEASKIVNAGLNPSSSQTVAGNYEFDFTPN